MFKSSSLVLIILSFSLNAQQKEYEKKSIVSNGLNVSSSQPYKMGDKKPRIIYSDLSRREQSVLILNGQETTFEMIKTLNPDKIESFFIEKGDISGIVKTKDRIIVKTKPNKSSDMISLVDLIKKYKIPKRDRMILSIDGELINENAGVMQFDESNLMQVSVISLDKVDQDGDLIYLKILTRTPENVKKANIIYIR